jgi:hypothetical protein
MARSALRILVSKGCMSGCGFVGWDWFFNKVNKALAAGGLGK